MKYSAPETIAHSEQSHLANRTVAHSEQSSLAMQMESVQVMLVYIGFDSARK